MHITKFDKDILLKALALAEKGRLTASPNPMVGAIIVKDQKIIGSGFHLRPGLPHAEIEAIAAAKKAGYELCGTTLYVTLEPCSTYGRTPPCTSAIIENKISKVVVGTQDPNPLHAGRAFNILAKKGIEIICANLAQCQNINQKFNFFMQHQRPFILAKWAMSLDGKIACYTGDSKWISNPQSREFVQRLRAEYDSIMVGIGTVLADDPKLNVRLQGQYQQPLKIIIDSSGRIPLDAQLLKSGKVIIATSTQIPAAKIIALKELGAEVFVAGEAKVDLIALCDHLASISITSILVEGGGTLLAALFEDQLVNHVTAFIAPKIIGGKDAQSPVAGQGYASMAEVPLLNNLTTSMLGQDTIINATPLFNSKKSKS